jgi:hypothetical protein
MATRLTLAEAVVVVRVIVMQPKLVQRALLVKVLQVEILVLMRAVVAVVVHQPLAQTILLAQAVMVAREHLGKVTQHLQAVAVLVH